MDADTECDRAAKEFVSYRVRLRRPTITDGKSQQMTTIDGALLLNAFLTRNPCWKKCKRQLLEKFPERFEVNAEKWADEKELAKKGE